MPTCVKCGAELVASAWVHEPFVWENAATIPAGGQTFQLSTAMCVHEADGGPLVVIEQRELYALRERLTAANQAALGNAAKLLRVAEQLTTLQQREQQARAWLAARAEQRAAMGEMSAWAIPDIE